MAAGGRISPLTTASGIMAPKKPALKCFVSSKTGQRSHAQVKQLGAKVSKPEELGRCPPADALAQGVLRTIQIIISRALEAPCKKRSKL